MTLIDLKQQLRTLIEEHPKEKQKISLNQLRRIINKCIPKDKYTLNKLKEDNKTVQDYLTNTFENEHFKDYEEYLKEYEPEKLKVIKEEIFIEDIQASLYDILMDETILIYGIDETLWPDSYDSPKWAKELQKENEEAHKESIMYNYMYNEGLRRELEKEN